MEKSNIKPLPRLLASNAKQTSCREATRAVFATLPFALSARVKRTRTRLIALGISVAPAAAFGFCPATNPPSLQQQCMQREEQQQEQQQQRAQQEQMQQQQRAQQEQMQQQQQRAQQEQMQQQQQRAQQEQMQQQQRAQQEQVQRQQDAERERARQQEEAQHQQAERAQAARDASQRQKEAESQAVRRQPETTPKPSHAQSPTPTQSTTAHAPATNSQDTRTSGTRAAAATTPETGTRGEASVPREPSGRKDGSATLSSHESDETRHRINDVRTGLSGVNRLPVPRGAVTTHANGSVTVKAVDGRQYGLRANGTLASYRSTSMHATLDPNGRVQSMHTGALDVSRGPHGARMVVMHRPDHTVVVSMGLHGGYVQRPVMWHGQAVVQRTYVSGGHVVTHLYAPYTYHGVALVNYVPHTHYVPAFYGWVYYPWHAPAVYAWGWTSTPWYQADTGYFVALPTYPSAALWLTDYILGGMLATAYELQQQSDQAVDAGPDETADDAVYAQTDTSITPQLKQALAEEVAQQVSSENAAAQNPQASTEMTGLSRALVQNHLFIVTQPLNVTSEDGHTCGLTSGDLLKVQTPPADNAIAAELSVEASRKADCPAHQMVTVTFEDLQEMQNGFRAQVDGGLTTLHDQQGQNGLPAAPMSAIAPPPRPIDDLPPPAPDAQALVSGAQQQADSSEAHLTKTAFGE